MKNNKTLFLFKLLGASIFLLHLQANAQDNDGKIKLEVLSASLNKQVTIKGNIKKLYKFGAVVDSFAFQYIDLVTAKRITIPIPKDSSGNFSVSFPVSTYQEVYLSQGMKIKSDILFTGSREFSFFVKSGEVMNLNYYTSVDRKIWSRKFGGPTGLSNDQFRLYTDKLDLTEFSSFIPQKESDSLKNNYEEFKKYVSTRLKAALAYNNDYFKTTKVNPEVKKRADINMKYYAAATVTSAIFSSKPKNPQLLEFLKQNNILVNNPDAYGYDSYRRFLDQYYIYMDYEARKNADGITITRPQMAQYLLKNDPKLSTSDRILALKILDTVTKASKAELSEFFKRFMKTRITEYMAALPNNNPVFDIAIASKDPFIRDLHATRALYEEIQDNKIAFIKPNLDRYKRTVNTGFIKDRFLKDYQQEYDAMYSSKLLKAQVINSSKNLDSENPLKAIIEKHKGKVIYVDVWATWCIPCLEGIKKSAKLRDKLHGKEVVFVYLCIDSPTDATWKQYIAAKDIQGENYFLDRDQSQGLVDVHDIRAIPRYLLIDKNGNIIKGNATRPDNPETFNEINELLATF